MAFKEIVTKAVIGKAKKTSTNEFLMETEEKPNTVLGCWVINHSFTGSKGNDTINIDGSFDINVWYSFDTDSKTAVSTRKFNYADTMNVPLKEDSKITSASEIIVRCLKQPTVANVSIVDGVVKLSIEKELGVEVVGEAKVKINVEDEEDDYEEIFDEVKNDEIDDIEEDYLKEE
ncbi:MAG: outer spore coat protein CotE [Bacilli bacterium]